jgi:hypothetical protein
MRMLTLRDAGPRRGAFGKFVSFQHDNALEMISEGLRRDQPADSGTNYNGLFSLPFLRHATSGFGDQRFVALPITAARSLLFRRDRYSVSVGIEPGDF